MFFPKRKLLKGVFFVLDLFSKQHPTYLHASFFNNCPAMPFPSGVQGSHRLRPRYWRARWRRWATPCGPMPTRSRPCSGTWTAWPPRCNAPRCCGLFCGLGRNRPETTQSVSGTGGRACNPVRSFGSQTCCFAYFADCKLLYVFAISAFRVWFEAPLWRASQQPSGWQPALNFQPLGRNTGS